MDHFINWSTTWSPGNEWNASFARDLFVNGTVASVPKDDGSDPNSGYTCHRFRFWLNAVVIAILCLVGLAGNTTAIIALRRDGQHHPVAAFLLQSLAVADNLVLLISFVVLTVFFGWLPLADAATVDKVLPYVITYVNPFGPIVQSWSIWITVMLAVNRYVAVCRPFSAAKRLTMKSARLQVGLAYIVYEFFDMAFIAKRINYYRLSNDMCYHGDDSHVEIQI